MQVARLRTAIAWVCIAGAAAAAAPSVAADSPTGPSGPTGPTSPSGSQPPAGTTPPAAGGGPSTVDTSPPASPAPPPAPAQAPGPSGVDAPAVPPGLKLKVPKPPPSSRKKQSPGSKPSRNPHAPAALPNGAANGLGNVTAPSPLLPGLGSLALNPLAPVLPDTNSVLSFFVGVYRVPPFLLPIYMAAGDRYRVPWQILAAINEVETNYGQDLSVSSAGAEGWMQFLPAEWLTYGVDANGAGVRDPYNPADAIFAAARYLAAAGAAHDLRGAIYAYNHSNDYVDSVLLRARLMAGAPRQMINSLATLVNGRFPVALDHVQAVSPLSTRPLGARRHSATVPHVIHVTAASATALARPAPASAASGSRSVIAAAAIAASPDVPVMAAQNAEVVGSGSQRALGRWIRLQDVFGNTYTYGRLGSVASSYALDVAPSMPRQASARPAGGASHQTAPLRIGAWIPAGTVIGNVHAGSGARPAHFTFEIRPSGVGRIDPRPVLQAWQQLGKALHTTNPAIPLFGPDARDALAAEIRLMSPQQLSRRLLTDPDLRMDTCAKRAIGSGLVGTPVLSALEFLVASRVAPTISGLPCAQRGARASTVTTSAHAVSISAIDGVSVRDHHASGSITDQVIRRLLSLPAALRPSRIVSPLAIRSRGHARVDLGRPDRISVEFTPSPASAASAFDSQLRMVEWRNLLAHLAELPEPSVAMAPTRAAVPDGADAALPPGGSATDLLALWPSLVAAESSAAGSGGGPQSVSAARRTSLMAAFAPLLGSASPQAQGGAGLAPQK